MVKAGVARVDITPPPGSIMACFPRRRDKQEHDEKAVVPGKPNRAPRRAQGVHDRLYARILVLSSGAETVALCVGDVLHFADEDVQQVRAMVAAQVPQLADSRVILAGTHTHSSPDTICLFGNTPDDPYLKKMRADIAAGVAEAYANQEVVSPYLGRGELALTHNRRVHDEGGRARMIHEYDENVTTGSVDPEAYVLRLDTAQGVKAILFNYTAHALTLGPSNDQYTADYPGEACRRVEAAFPGAMALFTNGAAGNIHPRQCMRGDFTVMAEMGGKLAHGVIRFAQKAEEMPEGELRHKSQVLTFPHSTDSSLTVNPEIHAVSLGPLTIGFVPGEFFVEFQLRFKEQLQLRPAFFVGYTGGWVGYVPTKEEFDGGGYGVAADKADPPERSRTSLPPGAGEEILARLVKLHISCPL